MCEPPAVPFCVHPPHPGKAPLLPFMGAPMEGSRGALPGEGCVCTKGGSGWLRVTDAQAGKAFPASYSERSRVPVKGGNGWLEIW